MSKLKGEIKLGQDISNKNDYWIYDENGFICGSLGVNEDKVKELISIANKEIPMNGIKIKQVPSGLPVNNGIELMNINLKGITLDKEIKKLEEEYGEFMNVINGEDEDTSFYHAVEELFDIVQAALGVIFLKYKKKASAVMRLYQYHEIKIQNRPRRSEKERGI